MQTEDLLDACLEAQTHGRTPYGILARHAIPDQYVEVESLLALAERLHTLAPPPLTQETRDAIAARLTAAMRADLAAGAWRN